MAAAESVLLVLNQNIQRVILVVAVILIPEFLEK
jgi:hypothetical protein